MFVEKHRNAIAYFIFKWQALLRIHPAACRPGLNAIAAGLNISRPAVKRAMDDSVKAWLAEKRGLTSDLNRIKQQRRGDSAPLLFLINKRY